MEGRLRSFLEFMNLEPDEFEVRTYITYRRIDELKTLHEKPFKLLNLPIFLTKGGWMIICIYLLNNFKK